MKTYYTKRAKVKAVQWTGDLRPMEELLKNGPTISVHKSILHIHTPTGMMHVSPGEWVVCKDLLADGYEIYSHSPESFNNSYCELAAYEASVNTSAARQIDKWRIDGYMRGGMQQVEDLTDWFFNEAEPK